MSALPSGPVVGLERTIYQVSEDVGVVEVCAVVYHPSGDCPITFPFNIALSSKEVSAVNRAGNVCIFEGTQYCYNIIW